MKREEGRGKGGRTFQSAIAYTRRTGKSALRYSILHFFALLSDHREIPHLSASLIIPNSKLASFARLSPLCAFVPSRLGEIPLFPLSSGAKRLSSGAFLPHSSITTRTLPEDPGFGRIERVADCEVNFLKDLIDRGDCQYEITPVCPGVWRKVI